MTFSFDPNYGLDILDNSNRLNKMDNRFLVAPHSVTFSPKFNKPQRKTSFFFAKRSFFHDSKQLKIIEIFGRKIVL